MSFRLRPFLAAGAVSAALATTLSASFPAQDEAPAAAAPVADRIDAKAKAIYDAGSKAAAALKDIELVSTMTLQMEGIDPSMLPPGFGEPARVSLDFTANPEMPRLRIDALADGTAKSTLVVDGPKAVFIDHAAKEFTDAGEGWMSLVPGAMQSLPMWIFERRAYAEAPEGVDTGEPAMVACALVGEEKVDGVDCEVVRVEREASGPGGEPVTIVETVAFAKSDHLPRRVGTEIRMPGAPVTSATYASVKANAGLDAKTFDMSSPEGFAKKELPKAAEPQRPELSVKAGDAAPDFTLSDMEGKEVALASLKGKVVLLDFWATWCGPCKKAMPTIQKLSEEYAGKDVVILGVNTWEQDPEAAKKYMKDKSFTYGCLMAGDDLAKAYNVPGIPTLVIIGKDGKVVMAEVGLADATGDSLRKAIDGALGG
jgi:thiol-disulfide isomerase/thioredoxin